MQSKTVIFVIKYESDITTGFMKEVSPREKFRWGIILKGISSTEVMLRQFKVWHGFPSLTENLMLYQYTQHFYTLSPS